MKNKIIKYLASAALAVGIVGTVQAIPIVDSVGFNGSFTQDGTAGDLTTATHLTIINPVVTPGTATFDFVGAGAPVTFASPIGVNGSMLPMIGQLWSVTVGPKTITMTVTTEAQLFTSATQLFLAGTGVMHDLSGQLSDTAGVWQVGLGVSGTPPTAIFTWQSTASASGPSAIVAQPVNQTVPVGGTATFSLTAAGATPLSYFWRRNGTPIAGATASSYTTNNVQLADSGSKFSCLVSNAYRTVLSSDATLTVTLVVRTNIFISTGVEIFWPSDTNTSYQVQRAANVDTNTWTNLGQLIQGNGSTNHFFDPFGNPSQMFYRVLQIP
jgi:hypothetical protein